MLRSAGAVAAAVAAAVVGQAPRPRLANGSSFSKESWDQKFGRAAELLWTEELGGDQNLLLVRGERVAKGEVSPPLRMHERRKGRRANLRKALREVLSPFAEERVRDVPGGSSIVAMFSLRLAPTAAVSRRRLRARTDRDGRGRGRDRRRAPHKTGALDCRGFSQSPRGICPPADPPLPVKRGEVAIRDKDWILTPPPPPPAGGWPAQTHPPPPPTGVLARPGGQEERAEDVAVGVTASMAIEKASFRNASLR